MGRTASAVAFAVCFEPSPARIVANTTSPSASAALNKYGWNAFTAGSNANAFTASSSITAMIETALIARMLTVDPFEAHRRSLPDEQYRISTVDNSGRYAG